VLLDEFLQIVQNLPLAFGEWLHGAKIPKERRKCNSWVQVHGCPGAQVHRAVTARSDGRSNVSDEHSRRNLGIPGE